LLERSLKFRLAAGGQLISRVLFCQFVEQLFESHRILDAVEADFV
jgi:hypothetical protein